ncbi:hypothetical protein LCGC14_1342650 [marine sediment metagenome]|uniref:Uncharacterized protein n=1 Tax=marine sediment metagenome TaxID=412755 RepID=A0A0F9KDW6_9ZZZZ
MTELPYAEDIGHYWQTSKSSPDQWIDRCKKLIESIGGVVVAEGFGAVEGRSAYMMAFEIGDNSFKVVWPVLPSATGKSLAARRQAATLLYHDIKAKALTASVLGSKVAFFSYMMLSDGRVASEVAAPELIGAFPFQLPKGEG